MTQETQSVNQKLNKVAMILGAFSIMVGTAMGSFGLIWMFGFKVVPVFAGLLLLVIGFGLLSSVENAYHNS